MVAIEQKAAPVLQLSGIQKSFQPGHPVLKDIELTVHHDEIFFLLGSSGCGKSTLLHIIAGLLEPDAGEILLNGTDITHTSPEKRNTPMVFQNYALWPHLNVYENIAFGLKARGVASNLIRKRVEELLEGVRMQDYIDRRITTLSGGQQQRIALARAMASEPSVLLLDEPLSNLDAKLRDEMRVEIRRICRERHLTAIYVTHDRREALSMGDRIAVMNQGVICQIGTPRDIYRRPANRFVASFLGSANFLSGKLSGMTADGLLNYRTGIGEFAVSPESVAQSAPPAHALLMFRPESVKIADAGGAKGFSAVLRESSYMGAASEYILTAENGMEIQVNETSAPERKCGDKLTLQVPPDQITLMPDETAAEISDKGQR